MTKHYVYILKCSDGSLYTGWTTDIKRRLQTHNEGKGAKYTRSRRPVELFYLEVFYDKSEALSREASLKRLSRQEKLQLVKESEYEKSADKMPADHTVAILDPVPDKNHGLC